MQASKHVLMTKLDDLLQAALTKWTPSKVVPILGPQQQELDAILAIGNEPLVEQLHSASATQSRTRESARESDILMPANVWQGPRLSVKEAYSGSIDSHVVVPESIPFSASVISSGCSV